MKRFLTIFGTAAVLTGVIFAATWGTGEGSKIAATTSPALLTFTTTLNTVSVYNSDATNDLFVLVDCSTNTLATRITAGTALPIPAGSSYTFDAQGNASIGSLCYATTNGTSTGYVAGY